MRDNYTKVSCSLGSLAISSLRFHTWDGFVAVVLTLSLLGRAGDTAADSNAATSGNCTVGCLLSVYLLLVYFFLSSLVTFADGLLSTETSVVEDLVVTSTFLTTVVVVVTFVLDMAGISIRPVVVTPSSGYGDSSPGVGDAGIEGGELRPEADNGASLPGAGLMVEPIAESVLGRAVCTELGTESTLRLPEEIALSSSM
jgi:hypothetical protein